MSEFKTCSKCQTPQDYREFRQARSGELVSVCITCQDQQRVKRMVQKPENFFRYKLAGMKQRASKAGFPMTIQLHQLVNLWYEQDGRCFYTQVQMTTALGKGVKEPTSISVDRIIPERGYVHGNVVLCIEKANRAKTDLTLQELKDWIPGWYEKIVAKLGLDPLTSGKGMLY